MIDLNISVALTTYNGEKYISAQLDSIIQQFDVDDEIIISDDNSTDNTINIINKYVDNDLRIKLFINKRKGISSNFQNSISNSSNEIVFLCDQDDIWAEDKVITVKNYFELNKVILIISDAFIVDSNLNIINESYYKFRNSEKGIIRNIIKNSYLGCAMAFRKELKNIILPIPPKVPMHDMWIGIMAETNGEVLFVPEKLIYYRRHNGNATQSVSKTSMRQKILWRTNLVKEIILRKINYRKNLQGE